MLRVCILTVWVYVVCVLLFESRVTAFVGKPPSHPQRYGRRKPVATSPIPPHVAHQRLFDHQNSELDQREYDQSSYDEPRTTAAQRLTTTLLGKLGVAASAGAWVHCMSLLNLTLDYVILNRCWRSANSPFSSYGN
jgi:hypothetical protein